MGLITEEMVEKALRAYGGGGMRATLRMRAALNAILPDIVEACANVVETTGNFSRGGIAAAIRALAPQRPE